MTDDLNERLQALAEAGERAGILAGPAELRRVAHRRRRRHRVAGAGVLAAAVIAIVVGVVSGTGGSHKAEPVHVIAPGQTTVPAVPSTSIAVTTEPQPGAAIASTSTTSGAGTTTSTRGVPQSVEYAGVAQVTVVYSPDTGPPGTHVHVSGSGFLGQAREIAQNAAYRFHLQIELPGCELIGQPADATVNVSASGMLSGSFTVPATGGCFQQTVTKALSPGQYQVLLGAHAAGLGTFTVATP